MLVAVVVEQEVHKHPVRVVLAVEEMVGEHLLQPQELQILAAVAGVRLM
jgi:hypothetical protein